LLLLGAAIAGSSPAVAEDAVAAPASPIERVRALSQVDGSAIGEGGDEGRFFALAKELLAKPDAVSTKDLLADPSPVARSMGLYLLVRTKGKDALPALRASLSDRTRYVIFPSGCCGWTTSVGGFARSLAHNRRFLEMEEPEPLVDAEALLGLDLAVLADDRASNQHDAVRPGSRSNSRRGAGHPTARRLRRRPAPPTSDRQAVGRMTATEPGFLVACPERGAREDARLAAASGATRSTHADAVAAIRRARAGSTAPGSPTDRLLATMRRGRRTKSGGSRSAPSVRRRARGDASADHGR
jgi:hypothetical protein